jgi:hypothetical protein
MYQQRTTITVDIPERALLSKEQIVHLYTDVNAMNIQTFSTYDMKVSILNKIQHLIYEADKRMEKEDEEQERLDYYMDLAEIMDGK